MSMTIAPTTIERFVATHLTHESTEQYVHHELPESMQRLLGTPAPSSRRAYTQWLFMFSYAAAIFVCGAAVGYAMRDHSEVSTIHPLTTTAREPGRLRIEYDLRLVNFNAAPEVQR